MLLEMHAHTSSYSRCSKVDPVTLVRQIVKKGLQGVVITEHHYLWNTDELNRLRFEAGVPAHFLVLSAQEVETDIGHVLVYGADVSIRDRTTLQELRNAWPQAALVFAHPFRNGRIPAEHQLRNPLLNAIEIFSLNHTTKENYTGLKYWHRDKFTAVCGSDTHTAANAGLFPTQFDHPVHSVAEVAEEIRKGRCRPFFKEIPKSGAVIQVIEITIGTKGENEQRNRIIIKSFDSPESWKAAEESAEISGRLFDAGFKDSSLRVPRLLEVDREERLLIEEGQRGKDLFELLTTVSPATGKRYLALAAEWLAKLHGMRLRLTDLSRTMEKERLRFVHYEDSFRQTLSPHAPFATDVVRLVRMKEEELFTRTADTFVQNHGDYHPKNIIIGQDRMHDPGTLFASVIDFDNSLLFSPLFDVGYFLAQLQSQLSAFPAQRDEYRDSDFIEVYRAHSGVTGEDFTRQVAFFKLRAFLSISSYLIKVGKGESEDLEYVVREMKQLYDSLASTSSAIGT